jgi:hypothetical protein
MERALADRDRRIKEVALAIGDRTHGAMASECNEWRERLEQAALAGEAEKNRDDWAEQGPAGPRPDWWPADLAGEEKP